MPTKPPLSHLAHPSQHGNRPPALQVSHRLLHLLRTILGAAFPQWRAVTGTCAAPVLLVQEARDYAAGVTLEPAGSLAESVPREEQREQNS
jgi:hypothetical protein